MFVVTGHSATAVPAIVAEAGAWLATVERLRVSTAARAAVSRVRLAIERLIAGSTVVDTGQHLVSTASGPIIGQLPDGPVEELLLHAPFHDHSGTALGALLDRYRPRTVSVAVQPGRTIVDPPALERAAAKRDVVLRWHDAGHRYRHGKLIEAVTQTGRWVLTGSANLTGAALLRGIDEGGNSEVGVVANVERSLYPGDGEPIETGSIPALKIISGPGEETPTTDHHPVLLAATLDEQGAAVVVELLPDCHVPDHRRSERVQRPA
ncbi:hypothetical protein [Georgenia yuyongxinii]